MENEFTMKNLEFREWSEPNRHGGMVNKFVQVILIFDGVEHDITPTVIELFGFDTPKTGKRSRQVIVNYNCFNFYLADLVRSVIKANKDLFFKEISKKVLKK
jgi:hypothetical protein